MTDNLPYDTSFLDEADREIDWILREFSDPAIRLLTHSFGSRVNEPRTGPLALLNSPSGGSPSEGDCRGGNLS